LDNDSLGLAAALVLRRHLRSLTIPVVVRMSQEAGLASLLQESAVDEELRGLYAFGLLGKTCRPELFLNGTHEILAQAIHEEYLREQQATGQTPKTNPSMLPWNELPENLKESNRSQAGHIGKKLRAIGCGLAPLVDWDADLFSFTKDEIELMARMEHDRWVDERKASGWTYSSGPKDIKKKKSPYLVPWDELPENIRDLDRNTVRALPGFLAKAGFQIERLNEA